jgi:spore cortex formation protein SpoVR/YcgB (stage V sporulation)
MEYEQLSKSYEYGLSKIYEMVINNNPSYAYLLEGNSLTDQKLVMATSTATSTSSRTTSASARRISTAGPSPTR